MLTKCLIQAMQRLLFLTLLSLILSMSNQPLQAQSVQSYNRAQKTLSLQRSLYSSSVMKYQAGEDSTGIPKIQLKKKFFGGQKFIYDSNEPKSVYHFGITFKPEFQEVMSLHPRALREAKKAYPYKAFQLAGSLGLVILPLKFLIDSVNKSQKLSSGQLVSSGFDLSYVVLVAISAGVAVISGILGENHLKKGVASFNERQERNTRLLTSKERVVTNPDIRTQAGQNSSSPKGLKLGFNFANVSVENFDGTKTNTGFSFGGFFNYSMGNILLQPEILFSQKGYEFNTTTVNITYLEIPVLAKISLPFSRFNPSLLIGPALGIKLSATSERNGQSSDFEGLKSTDLGIIFGIDGKLGNLPMLLDIRYNLGLTSIADGGSLKNRVFSIMLGYTL